MTELPDDGTGPAGGWQGARASLKFHGVRPGLVCTVKVEIPLRTEAHGRISAQRAAELSAATATNASILVRALNKDREWIGQDFCRAWRDKMKELFGMPPFNRYGARVKQY